MMPVLATDYGGVGVALGGIAALLVAIAPLIVGLSNGRKLDAAVGKTEQIHNAVNSNLDKLRLQFYGACAVIGLGIVWLINERSKNKE